MKSSRRKKPRGQLQRHQRHGVFHGHRPYSRRGLYTFICLAKCGRNNTGKVPASGIKLPKQTVQIFNVAFLPGAIRVGKIDFTIESLFNLKPVGELRTPVAGNRLDQLRREGRPCSNNSVFHSISHGLDFSVRHLHGNVKPSLALCQSGKAGFAFALAAHCRTRFPSTGFLTAVYRLASFSNRLPFAVFPSCFFRFMALPFAPQHFQAAVYQIFFIDSTIDRTPAGHLQFARDAGNLFWRPGRF